VKTSLRDVFHSEPFDIGSTTLAAGSGGNSYAGTYSEAPNEGTAMFDGQEVNSSTISLTITESGSPIVTEIETAYYLENPYQPLGSGTYYVVNTNNAIGSLTETYSVTSTGNWVFLNTYATGTVNGQSISQTISYSRRWHAGRFRQSGGNRTARHAIITAWVVRAVGVALFLSSALMSLGFTQNILGNCCT
jgi:hypothetical protein